MGVFQVEDDDGDDIAGVGNPVVRIFLAFVVGNDVGDVLRRRDFTGRTDGNLIEGIPTRRGTVIRCRFELDDLLAHLLAVACRDAPVFRLDVVDDDGLFPAAKECWDDEADALPGTGRGDDDDVPAVVIAEIEVAELLIQRRDVVIEAFPERCQGELVRLVIMDSGEPFLFLCHPAFQLRISRTSFLRTLQFLFQFRQLCFPVVPFLFKALIVVHFAIA